VGAIKVHEFMSLDGVIDAPTWTFEYGFDPKWERPSPGSRNPSGVVLPPTLESALAQR